MTSARTGTQQLPLAAEMAARKLAGAVTGAGAMSLPDARRALSTAVAYVLGHCALSSWREPHNRLRVAHEGQQLAKWDALASAREADVLDAVVGGRVMMDPTQDARADWLTAPLHHRPGTHPLGGSARRERSVVPEGGAATSGGNGGGSSGGGGGGGQKQPALPRADDKTAHVCPKGATAMTVNRGGKSGTLFRFEGFEGTYGFGMATGIARMLSDATQATESGFARGTASPAQWAAHEGAPGEASC